MPLSLGWWSNSIVLPVGLADELSDRQLEDIFVHEAAHLARRDAWVAVLQQLATALFWWNIFLILINRRLARLREEICDDYVLAEGGDGRRFAETLVRVAEWSVNRNTAPRGRHLAALEHRRTRRSADTSHKRNPSHVPSIEQENPACCC